MSSLGLNRMSLYGSTLVVATLWELWRKGLHGTLPQLWRPDVEWKVVTEL